MAGNETVIVGCKLPHGLHLSLHDKDGNETGRVTVVGANAPADQRIGEVGITSGVPKEFWDEWVKRNKNAPAVSRGLVFAQAGGNNAVAEAKDKADLRSGFEALDPAKPDPTGEVTASDERGGNPSSKRR